MENSKKHLVSGTIICLATILLFLAFGGRLPDNVPLQISADGSVGNTLPKPLLVFGMPLVFAIVQIVKSLPLTQKAKTPAYSFYIIPGIAVLVSLAVIFLF